MPAVLNQQSERPGEPGGHSPRAINGKPSSATPGPPGPPHILKEPPCACSTPPPHSPPRPRWP
ncbi:hypothetical protein BOG92_007135 [Streptomyces sp. WAC00263]|nr:hypothetical protein BOG92_007135 [Streptomyces sp. WAC00263]